MATIVTRAGKGSPLTNNEVDANFTNLNSAQLVAGGTGVTASYVSSVAVGGTTFAQPAVTGTIDSDQGNFNIDYAGATGVTVANLSSASTYVYIDKDGALQQQTTLPTREDWTRKIFTMRIAVESSVILGFEYLNNPIGHYANSIRDVYAYLLAQGIPFKKDQTVTGRSADLGFDISAGSLLEFGGTGDIYNPNIKDFNAVSNAQFFLSTRTAFDAGGNTDLPKVWDNNGVLTALGSTTLVGHRLYRFSNGNVCLQYGQGNYANMALAKSGVVLENYVLNPALANATFYGWWFIESTATNTGGTTLTDFVEYTIGVQGGSSGALAGCLLKGNNLSDLLDAGAARTNIGLGTGDSPTFAGATVTGEITANGGIALGDNDKATFGAGDDLQIYHDGSNSYIQDSGSGDLVLKASSNLVMRGNTSNDLLAVFSDGGASNLYYDNAPKLATTSTGIDVTGSVVADGLTVTDGVNGIMQLGATTAQRIAGGTGYGGLRYYSATHHEFFNTSNQSKLRIDTNGNVSFYEETGSTPKMVWDASAESLGIGTSSPDTKLHLVDSTPEISLTRTSDFYYGRLSADGFSAFSNTNSNAPIIFKTATNERMRISSDGSVGIGTSSPTSPLTVKGETLVQEAGANGNAAIRVQYGNDGDTALRDRARLMSVGYSGVLELLNSSNVLTTKVSSNSDSYFNGGNVGIGEATPKGPLHVYGTEYSYFTSNIAGVTPHSTTQGIALGWNKSGGAGESIIAHNKGGGSGGGLVFANNDGGVYREDMRISSAGSVGIGTSTPASPLHLLKAATGINAATTMLKLSSVDTNPAYYVGFQTQRDNSAGQGLNILVTNVSGTVSEAMRILPTGNVGIGESNPATWKLHVKTADSNALRLLNSGGAGNTIDFVDQSWQSQIQGNSGSLLFKTGGTTERMRIDAIGNLLVGQSATTVPGVGNTTAGSAIGAAGYIFVSKSGDTPAHFNRNTNDGDIITLRKDGTTVGSIGSVASNYLSIGTGDTGILFQDDNDFIEPCNVGTSAGRDNAISLGHSGGRFKNLYLSGASRSGGMEVSGTPPLSFGASKLMVQQEAVDITRLYTCGPDASTYGQLSMYTAKSNGTPIESLRIQSNASVYLPSGLNLGGTGAANKLEDYEEGTWTPIIKDGTTSGATLGISVTRAHYTKVGRMCTITAHIGRADATALTQNMIITNLPFTQDGGAQTGGVIWIDNVAADQLGMCYANDGTVMYFRSFSNTNAYILTNQFENGRALYFSRTYETT